MGAARMTFTRVLIALGVVWLLVNAALIGRLLYLYRAGRQHPTPVPARVHRNTRTLPRRIPVRYTVTDQYVDQQWPQLVDQLTRR